MFRKWWRRRRERRAAQERKDAEAMIDARREVEHWDRSETDLSEAEKIPPTSQITDWPGAP